MDSTKVLARLFRLCLDYPGRVGVMVFSILALTLSRLYLTWLVKLWVEGPLSRPEAGGERRLLLAGGAAVAVMAASVFLSHILLADVNQRMLHHLRNQLQKQLMQLGVRGLRRFHSGDLFSRVFNDIGMLGSFVRDVFNRLIGESLVAAGALTLMFTLNWRLALITCLIVPTVALVLQRLSGLIRRWAEGAQRNLGLLSGVLGEQIQGITTIKGFQTEDFEHARFSRQNTKYRRRFIRAEIWSATLMSIVWGVTGGGLLLLVWYGSRVAAEGLMSAGDLLAFCLFAAQTVEPLRKLSEVQAVLLRSAAAAARVFEVIDMPLPERGGGRLLPRPIRGDLLLEGIRFRYEEETPLLEEVTFRIRPGETAALVSPSGGGKSTLAKLLWRFHEPQGGFLSIDGHRLDSLSLTALRQTVCVVEQDPFIFSGSLGDNIRYGSWQASAGSLERAVNLAGLKPLVAALPAGLETILEEAGHNLSGGQKQRIALARAVVRNPAILVLDEATSALDSDTEARIFEALAEWLSSRTVLVMAHRLSTVVRFGRVLMLEHGRIAGDGRPAELIEACPPFRRLFQEQLSPV